MQNNSFLRKDVKSGHFAISWKPKNRYFKLCVITVIDNCCIFLTIKLLLPLIKGKLLFIHTCIFKNRHKCYPSRFYRCKPQIKFSPCRLMSMSALSHEMCLVIVSTCGIIYPCTPCSMDPRSSCRSWYFSTSVTADFSSPYRIFFIRFTIRSSPKVSSRYCLLMPMVKTS